MTTRVKNLEKKKQAFDIWDLSEEERKDQDLPNNILALSKYLDVSRGSVLRWEDEYKKSKGANGVVSREEIVRNLKALSVRSPEACKTLLKELGEENGHDEDNLSASDYIRLAREARNRIIGLSGEVGRDISLCEQSPLLLGEVCDDSGQGEEEEG